MQLRYFIYLNKKNPCEYMLQTFLNKCLNKNLYPDHVNVHIDFEKTAISAVSSVLEERISIKGYFFYITQSTNRKIQSLGQVNLCIQIPWSGKQTIF